MPKMRTKSSCKKRFTFTATGKVRATQAGKRHGMIKRTNKQIRQQRGTTILQPGDAGLLKSYMPYPSSRSGVSNGSRQRVQCPRLSKKIPSRPKVITAAARTCFRAAASKRPQYAYRDRRQRKRNFAPCGSRRRRELGPTHGCFINGLDKAGVEIDRVLADLAVRGPRLSGRSDAGRARRCRERHLCASPGFASRAGEQRHDEGRDHRRAQLNRHSGGDRHGHRRAPAHRFGSLRS